MANSTKSLKSTIFLIVLIFLFLAGSIVSVVLPRLDFSVLKPYTLEGTTMSVMLPSAPRKNTTTLDSIAGKLETVEFSSGVGALLITINYTDLPASALPDHTGDSIERFFQNALDRILTTTNARVLDRTTVEHEPYAGEDILLRTPTNISIRTRFLLVGNRFIQLTATTTSDNIKNKKIDEFFESFRLVEN